MCSGGGHRSVTGAWGLVEGAELPGGGRLFSPLSLKKKNGRKRKQEANRRSAFILAMWRCLFPAAPSRPETPATSNGPKERRMGETEQSHRELRKAWSEKGVVGMVGGGGGGVYTTHMPAQKVAGPQWQMVKLTFQQFLFFHVRSLQNFYIWGKKKRVGVLFFFYLGEGGAGSGVVGGGEGVRYSTAVWETSGKAEGSEAASLLLMVPFSTKKKKKGNSAILTLLTRPPPPAHLCAIPPSPPLPASPPSQPDIRPPRNRRKVAPRKKKNSVIFNL